MLREIQLDHLVPSDVRKRFISSENVCGQCHSPLMVYVGPEHEEFDWIEFERLDMRPGLTLPCGECRRRLSILFGEVEKMRFMRNRADAEPPMDRRGKDAPPSIEFLRKKERSQCAYDQQKRHLDALAANWGWPMESVYECMADRERRRLKYQGAA